MDWNSHVKFPATTTTTTRQLKGLCGRLFDANSGTPSGGGVNAMLHMPMGFWPNFHEKSCAEFAQRN